MAPGKFGFAAADRPPTHPAGAMTTGAATTMRHYWWHRQRDGYYAVATDGAGQIVSAWVQVARHEWEPLDDFTPLEAADLRGEWHKNPYGYTDELGPSRGPVQ